MNLPVIDRTSQQKFYEQVYGSSFLELLYGRSFLARTLGKVLAPCITRFPLFSSFYGWLQKRSSSKKKVRPFVEKYQINHNEFLLPLEQFASFNDFFIRKLKPEARPIAPGEDTAILPADGRYLFYPNLSQQDGFVVKGKRFSLSSLLASDSLAKQYENGSMVIIRLCPIDYHRYHFPCSGTPSAPQLIPGAYFSVNPIALKQRISIFTENKRLLSLIQTKQFGQIAFIQVGATNVSSIIPTYTPQQTYKKGEELGYFSFGGSSIILLFQQDTITFAPDLLQLSANHQEVYGQMGQVLGHA